MRSRLHRRQKLCTHPSNASDRARTDAGDRDRAGVRRHQRHNKGVVRGQDGVAVGVLGIEGARVANAHRMRRRIRTQDLALRCVCGGCVQAHVCTHPTHAQPLATTRADEAMPDGAARVPCVQATVVGNGLTAVSLAVTETV